MAIAFDSSATAGNPTGTSGSFSHTFSGSDSIVFISIWIQTATDAITSVTVAGNNATQLGKMQAGGGAPYWQYMYYYVAPPTGSQNITVNKSVGGDFWAYSTSYTGVDQISPIDTSNTGGTTGTSLGIALTSTVDNCWYVGGFRSFANTLTFSDTIRVNSPQNTMLIGDFGPRTPAGIRTITASCISSGAMTGIVGVFKPSISNNRSGFFQFF